MLRRLLTAAAVATLASSASMAAEEVTVLSDSDCLDELAEVRETYGSLGRFIGAEDRRDMDILGNAARVFARVGKEDACEEVVEEIEDMLEARRRTLLEEGILVEPNQQERLRRLRQAVPIQSLKAPLRAGDVASAELRSPANEVLGDVEDIILNPDQTISHLLVRSGGFLGMGANLVAVPIEFLRITEDREALVLDMSRDRLEDAPSVARDDLSPVSDPAWQTENRSYFQANLGK